MIKTNRFVLTGIISTILIATSYTVCADQTIINNNNQPPDNSAQCNNSYGTSGNGLPPGAYTIQNGNGSTDRLYTTGDKQPYIVDNNCNQSPVIQPYVYTQPPYAGPTPSPGPKPGPAPHPGPMR